MNKKDILTDFCVYLLLHGNEFRNNELFFFDTKDKSKVNYENYVTAINRFVDVEDFLWDSDVNEPISKVKSLNDLISNKEIEFLQDYIKQEFSFGYPNEINEDGLAWGGTFKLDFSIQDIESFFNDYLGFRKINSDEYITYYQQFLNYLINQSRNIISTTESKVDAFHKSENSINTVLYSELKDNLKSDLKTKLLEYTQIVPFQIQGFFDKFGLVSDYKNTLALILEVYNSKYSKFNLEIEPKHYFALLEYHYYLYKIENTKIAVKSENQKSLEKEFKLLKKENTQQIEYLKTKGFDTLEIEIILNCFCLNKFNSIGIRYIQNISQVDFFRLFYFFYRFEFLKEIKGLKLDSQTDFSNTAMVGEININDYKKYYDHSNDLIIRGQISHKRYPFNNPKKLFNKIESELHIDLTKLNIPDNLKKSN